MMRVRTSVVLAGVLAAGLAPAAEAAPQLSWLYPSGGQRGVAFEARVGGTGLENLTGVVVTHPGIEARILPAEKDGKTERALQITVAPDAPLGRHEVRLIDKTGASNPKFFYVGQFPELREAEPNDGRSNGQQIELPATVNGQIGQRSDIDSYTFRARRGEEISIEFHAVRLLGEMGNSWLKGYAWVENSQGEILVDNDGYYDWDPYLQFVAPEDGEYTVSYRDIQYRGNPMGVYRMTVGVLPHLWSVYPLGGLRGTTARVRLLGCNLGEEVYRDITLPPDAPEGLREVRFQVGGVWTNPQLFAVSRYPSFLEHEPNNHWREANAVEGPVEVQGILDRPGDVDSFRFRVRKGQRLVFEVVSRQAELPMDSLLVLRKADGSMVAENDDSNRQRPSMVRHRDSLLERTFNDDGEYVVQVRDIDERGGPAFVYRLSIAPPRPDFALEAQNDKPVVKPGGEVSFDVKLLKQDGFDEDVMVTVSGLPEGVTAEPLTIAKGKDTGKLVLKCALGVAHQAVILQVRGEARLGEKTEQRLAWALETYNIQGTAFRRDLIGPVLVVGE